MLLQNLFLLSNVVQLPPISNIYCATVNVPLIGKQNIEYERLSELKSEIRLSGIINNKAYISYDLLEKDNIINSKNQCNKLYKYTLDEELIKILKKYRCELSNPTYNSINDIASINIFVKLINFNKLIILKNKNL